MTVCKCGGDVGAGKDKGQGGEGTTMREVRVRENWGSECGFRRKRAYKVIEVEKQSKLSVDQSHGPTK